MKRIAIGLIATGVVLGLFVLGLVPNKKPLLGGVLSARADEGCSVATLEGDYLMTGRADTPADDPQPTFPRVFAGVFTFDGNGNMLVLHTRSDGGVITQHQTARATYTLDSDCSGHVTFLTNEWDVYATRDGKKGYLIRTDDGTIATRTFEKP